MHERFRIIGGEWRSRRFRFPAGAGLRPSPDRVRETLFNWLMPVIAGARCLDLYAGSGALGLEALSRGAAEVVFVDRERAAVEAIESHLAVLECGRGRVVHADVSGFLQDQANRGTEYRSHREGRSHEYRSHNEGRSHEYRSHNEGRPHPFSHGGSQSVIGDPFDVVFVDPPYRLGLLTPACAALAAGGWVGPGTFVYLEAEAELGEPGLPAGWALHRSGKAGQVGYHLARIT